jgi:hypothetical protein
MEKSSLENFIQNHYGFGNLKALYWLIGMEPGGGETWEEVCRRVDIWHDLTTTETADLVEYHLRLKMPQLFRDPVKLQPTWAGLIRLVLAVKGEAADTAAVKHYQRDHLGRLDGETCLLELLPLSSSSIGKWHYAQWSDLPYLESRKTYEQQCLPGRIQRLRQLIQQHAPPLVVFYGFKYRAWYEQAAGCQFSLDTDGAVWAMQDGSLFVMIKHPAAHGMSRAYYERVGSQIREKLAEGVEDIPPPRPPQALSSYAVYRCRLCGKYVFGFGVTGHMVEEHPSKATDFILIKASE